MSTRVWAAEILDSIAKRRNLEDFGGTPLYLHSGVDGELVGWLGGPLPEAGYPCEFKGMDDEGFTSCWSSTTVNRLREENAKLRDLALNCYRMARQVGSNCRNHCSHWPKCCEGDSIDHHEPCELAMLARELGIESK